MIPAHSILHYTAKAGIPDAIETVWVRHVRARARRGAISTLQLKSYDQRREACQGTAIHGVHLDEECPIVAEHNKTAGITLCDVKSANHERPADTHETDESRPL